jgi:hypothetical protein
VYDYITKLCRKHTEVIEKHGNEHARGMEQGEAIHGIYKRLKINGSQAYERPSDYAAVVA